MEEEKKENIFENAFESDADESAPKEEEHPVTTVATEAPEEEHKTGLNLENADKEAAAIENEKQWYVVNTYAGRERTVADYLEKRRVSMNQENTIFRIVVAQREEDSIDHKTGKPIVLKDGTIKKHTVNFYPGYIFVEAIMTDLAWYIIRNTPGVTGIVGSSGSGTKPFPIPKEDMVPILKSLNMEAPEVTRSDYAVGERVLIVDGAFANEEGEITNIDNENASADVSVTFFGRPTTVTLPFSSLQKLNKQN